MGFFVFGRDKKKREAIFFLFFFISKKKNTHIRQQYDVDKVLGMRTTSKGEKEYLVHWKGYDSKHDTWEPRRNMNDRCLLLVESLEEEIIKRINT